MKRIFRKLFQYIADMYRWHKINKADEMGLIPSYWDMSADCGYSDKLYRCRKCDVCEMPRWIDKSGRM